jgi:hypothetical protein
MLKQIRTMLTGVTVIILLAACGGGGGGGGGTSSTPPAQPTKAIVKLATSGTLPAGVNIAGLTTTVNYPTTKGLSIADNDIAASGVAINSTLAPNTNTPGQAILGNFTLAGGFPIGEFATLTFSFAAGTPPLASDFNVDLGATKIIATDLTTLQGVSVVIQSVTFQ